MPRYECKWPTCLQLLERPGYCPAHAPQVRSAGHRHYDQTRRDKEAKKFYASQAWLATRRAKLAMTPVCERCGRAFATEVHHKVEVRTSVADRLAMGNLEALCKPCHSRISRRRITERRKGSA